MSDGLEVDLESKRNFIGFWVFRWIIIFFFSGLLGK